MAPFNKKHKAEVDRIAMEKLRIQQYYAELQKAAMGSAFGQIGPMPIPMPSAPKPEPPSLPSEKRNMPVVGFRVWTYGRVFDLSIGWRPWLASTGMIGNVWQHGDLTARCTRSAPSGYYLSSLMGSPQLLPMSPPHEAPDQHCGCGFYVLRDLAQVASHVAFGDDTIAGAVMGWGKVIQHGDEGWRAQHVRLLALMDAGYNDENTAKAQVAAEAYRVPMLGRQQLVALASEYGDPLDAKLAASGSESD